MPDLGAHRWRRAAAVLGLPLLVWYVVLVGVGLLVSGPAAGLSTGGEEVVEALEARRTPEWNTVTDWVSTSADTPVVVAAAVLVGLLLRWAWRTWVPTLLLWAGVAVQSSLFLLTTLVVDRERPDVQALDEAPPTSAFPSGHAGAATALWLGLALVLAGRLRPGPVRVLLVAVLLLPPAAVAASRLYRGLHLPGDVVFGLLNGVVAVLVVRRAVSGRESSPDLTSGSDRRSPSGSTAAERP